MRSTESLGLRIRMARRRERLSQAGLADLLGVGRSAVANWECGKAKPSTQHLQHLSAGLQVSLDWLATGTGAVSSAETMSAMTATAGTLSAEEGQLLQAYRQAPKYQQRHILQVAAALSTATARWPTSGR